MTIIGIISDTHGLLRPEAVKRLKTCDTVMHAGDIGDPEILAKLKAIAPTFAVRGNMDYGAWARSLPVRDVCVVDNRYFYLLHDLHDLDIDPSGEFDIVISGHSHRPDRFEKNGVLYFNPGSAGPRRHGRPVTMGCISIDNDHLSSEIVTLIA